jgi:hypothetical protein
LTSAGLGFPFDRFRFLLGPPVEFGVEAEDWLGWEDGWLPWLAVCVFNRLPGTDHPVTANIALVL